MRQSRLPIPLILLTPLVLLALVVAAGVYRFSLSDEEILAKFPAHTVPNDPIVEELFRLRLLAPLTIAVPETFAFALIDRWDEAGRYVVANYDSGQERGVVALDTYTLIPLSQYARRYGYAGIIRVSNQGSAVMHYLALFEYDTQRQRMVMADSQWLGDRIVVEALTQKDDQLNVSLLTHAENQPLSDAPTKFKAILFAISQKYQLIQSQ